MNQEIALRWIDRLRNGNIRQLHSQLGTTDGRRCCLGVLCDIAVEDGIIGPPQKDEVDLHYDGNKACLPSQVVTWAELRSDTGFFGPWQQGSLAIENDCGVSFPHIAKMIEDNIEDL